MAIVGFLCQSYDKGFYLTAANKPSAEDNVKVALLLSILGGKGLQVYNSSPTLVLRLMSLLQSFLGGEGLRVYNSSPTLVVRLMSLGSLGINVHPRKMSYLNGMCLMILCSYSVSYPSCLSQNRQSGKKV